MHTHDHEASPHHPYEQPAGTAEKCHQHLHDSESHLHSHDHDHRHTPGRLEWLVEALPFLHGHRHGEAQVAQGEVPGLTLRGFFLTVHEGDCWKLARETRRCPIEGDNITEHFWDMFAELQQIWLLPLAIKTVSP